MNKEQYIQWIKNRTEVSASISVDHAIKKYPYCMTLHLFRALQSETAANKAMLAILHPDRKQLATLFFQKKNNVVSEPLSANKTDKTTAVKIKEEKSDKTLADEIRLKERMVKEVLDQTKDKEALLEILQKRVSELNQEANKEQAESMEEEVPYEPEASVSLDELIEKFNTMSLKIAINADDSDDEHAYKDLGKSSLSERMNIVSETLAELYCSQQAYDKAIKIYEALSLKYPEKNAIFANIISEIKEKKKS
ncbi:MAG: hypothetical protein LBQ64_03515 [Bacteroidales bacterium]|jgi:hypothetical protein|nr:hypothetical protein [Bacteroidales bacterium]